MFIDALGITDTGKIRDNNQDCFFCSPSDGLFIVADGMGGHLGGDAASQIAVEQVSQKLLFPDQHWEVWNIKKKNDYLEVLKNAYYEANLSIYSESQINSKLHGMGTTLVTAWIKDKITYVANVGDSRAYLIRNSQIKQLTKDHSWVQEQFQRGLIDQQTARIHPLKNIVTRAIGTEPYVNVDLDKLKIQSGDQMLLCSDGLTNLVSDEEILAFFQKYSPNMSKTCAELVQLANECGGDDNITVICIYTQL